MSDLVFSLQATLPVFLLMMIGYVFRRIRIIDDVFADRMNSFVFKVALPVTLFRQLATTDFISVWNGRFTGFCLFATAAGILLCILISGRIADEKEKRAEFIQASYRSSQALLGLAYITNMYSEAVSLPLMIIGSVPLYNIAAVLILMMGTEKAEREDRSQVILKAVKGVIKNPIIVGIAAGILWSLLKLPYGTIFSKTVTNIAQLSTPLGLLGMGAGIDLKKVSGEMKPVLAASFIKLIGLCALFLPAAVVLGFRNEQLATLLIMMGAPTTVSSYAMARSMGCRGDLTAGAVVCTTVMSGFTLTFWIWLLRVLSLI
ncbi:MAG: AEC family transporter [Solobacterium sp.]|nr:AEC family transporter [Solobacterium sp.]